MTTNQQKVLSKSIKTFLDCEAYVYDRIPKRNFEPSESFNEKIDSYKILASKHEAKRQRKSKIWRTIVIAAIIAIMLFVTACAFYDSIVQILTTHFDNHTDVTISSSSAPTTIEKAADINIIPEEYLFVDRKILSNSVSTCWSNGEKSFILFQNTLVNYTTSFDTEASGMQEYCFGTYTIYHAVNHSTRVLLWKNDEYVFTLTCPDEYDWTFLENVILDIEEDFK